MYIKTSSDPKTEPCGTPRSLVRVSGIELLMETLGLKSSKPLE